ncbi:hypothetical protein GCM10010452_42630 [Crossiella cryophila]
MTGVSIDREVLAGLVPLLRCPACSIPALTIGSRGLDCDSCGHLAPFVDGVLDLVANSTGPVSAGDKPYEGLNAKLYGWLMSSPTRQRLDSWLLGLDVKRYYSEMADRIAGLPDGPILEIPAGNGPLFKQAAGYRDRGPWIFADLSWHLLKQLAAKVEAVGAKRHLIIRADACALPIVDGTMAGAVSMFGIHCFHDKSAVFGELRRVVSEEGQIAVSTLTTDGHKLSQYYHQMSQKDGTFAPDNSWAEISTAARGQGLELHGTTGLGSARVFTARPKIHS